MKPAPALLAIQQLSVLSDQFSLRRLCADDAYSLSDQANNPKIANRLQDRFPSPYAEEDAHEFIAYTQQSERESVFTIDINGKAVGAVGLILQHDIYRLSAEMGYWLGESFWGRGVVSQAVNRVAQHAFEDLGLQRVFAHVFEGNEASCRVLEKAGFEKEGLLSKAAIKQGAILDVHLYAKTV